MNELRSDGMGSWYRFVPGGQECISPLLKDKLFFPDMHPLDRERYYGLQHAGFSCAAPSNEVLLDDLPRLARIIKGNVEMNVCRHHEGGHGFWGNKRACSRRAESDDRCAESGPNKEAVKEYLMRRFKLSAGDADRKIDELRSAGLITTYVCGAVFFNQ